MSQYIAAPVRQFTAGAALGQHIRVELSGGKLAACGADDPELGTTREESFADGDEIGVCLRTAQGTAKFTAAGAITAGAKVYGAASGKIDDTVNGCFIGVALEAATADGDVIEVLRGGGPVAATLIADPSGGATQDAEARTAINAILDILEDAGLMLSS